MKLYFSRTEQITFVILVVAILSALLVLSYAFGRRAVEGSELPYVEQASSSTTVRTLPSTGSTPKEVVVHLIGAVKSPGLYRFAPGARIGDAIAKAGGATEDGYPDALNLAAHLPDGAQITVPTKAQWAKMTAEKAPPALVTVETPDAPQPTPIRELTTKAPETIQDLVVVPNTSTQASAPVVRTEEVPREAAVDYERDAPARRGPKPLPSKPVSLNSATQDELMTLPGVGEKTAERILAYRREHGRFDELEELLNVKGIGPKTFEKVRPYIKL